MADEKKLSETEAQKAEAAEQQAQLRQAEAEQAARETNPADETVPGGRYIVGGGAMDAHGHPVKDK